VSKHKAERCKLKTSSTVVVSCVISMSITSSPIRVKKWQRYGDPLSRNGFSIIHLFVISLWTHCAPPTRSRQHTLCVIKTSNYLMVDQSLPVTGFQTAASNREDNEATEMPLGCRCRMCFMVIKHLFPQARGRCAGIGPTCMTNGV
jgi:hypothetical protein